MKFDSGTIRIALEYAHFTDYRIRDSVNELLKNIQLDLDEAGYEPGRVAQNSQTELETLLSEIEAPMSIRRFNTPNEVVEELEGVREVPETIEIDDVSTPVVNVDDELDEFDS